MKIAIVGGGIAGLAAAWLLKEAHEVTLFESADYLGGHARSLPIDHAGTRVWAETGFKYFMKASHPTVIALMRVLGLSLKRCPSSITITRQGRGTTAVLPPRTAKQLAYLLRAPRELRNILLLRKLSRQGDDIVRNRDWTHSLRDHLREGFPPRFGEDFLYPFFAANWGAPVALMPEFPVYDVLKVMKAVPEGYYEVEGGSSSYIGALVRELNGVELRPGRGVTALRREGSTFSVEEDGSAPREFDAAVLATPWNVAARLTACSPALRPWHEVVRRFRHWDTTIVIHSDPALMPERRKDWSIINHFYDNDGAWTTEWSGWKENADVFRTWLLPGRPDPKQLYHRVAFEHLIVTPENVVLQRELTALQGKEGLFLAGMYTTDIDIHESSLASAVTVARKLAPDSPGLRRLDLQLG